MFVKCSLFHPRYNLIIYISSEIMVSKIGFHRSIQLDDFENI